MPKKKAAPEIGSKEWWRTTCAYWKGEHDRLEKGLTDMVLAGKTSPLSWLDPSLTPAQRVIKTATFLVNNPDPKMDTTWKLALLVAVRTYQASARKRDPHQANPLLPNFAARPASRPSKA